jgi:hypothetical protein
MAIPNTNPAQTSGSSVLQHSEARSIGEILDSPHWQHACSHQTLRQCRVITWWHEASDGIAQNYTRSVNCCNSILYVELTSSALRHELMMQRTDIIKKINTLAGERVITKIVLK